MTPLDGLLVADFSRVLAGPLATMTLADLGATVVKVERPGVGDETRSWGPPWSATSSTYFDSVNRSKLGVALDFADAADLAAAQELARRADVVVHNLRGLGRFGLDYAAVAAGNERVVYCSITGFGPGSDRPGYDFLLQAMGGLMSITGDADGQPHKVGVAVVDVLSGKDAVIGILAALTARERTGRGEHVQIDLLSSLLGSLANQAGSFLATGTVPRRMGNRHPSIAPYETLNCADGLLAVACGNDAQFARLAHSLGVPGLAIDERFATNAARVSNRQAMVDALEDVLRGDSAAQWEQRLTAADVPVAQVGDLASAFTQADAFGLAPTVEVGDARQVRHAVRYASAPGPLPAAPSPPPALGEHTDAVRAWLAGPPDAPPPTVG
ncbi:CaiB/BaiF CoA transferase family protein [uncultured Jatrophihabitans sp.]|uniref:CaiB/BaiF CoA transferase family protein n=1 Tax=uncultured Jatrophihabitans sp. TaxID=1610747 RepID=UPI0035CA0E1E